MLLLVAADGNVVRLIEQNVRRHQGGVGEQAAVDVLGVFGALVLKLRHTRELAEHGVAVEHPAELGVRGHMALDEERVLFRVETAGDVLRELLDGAAAQVGGVLPHGDRVQVGHEIIAVKDLGALAPVFDRAQIRPERQITGGLDAGEHHFFCCFFFHFDYFLNCCAENSYLFEYCTTTCGGIQHRKFLDNPCDVK